MMPQLLNPKQIELSKNAYTDLLNDIDNDSELLDRVITRDFYL